MIVGANIFDGPNDFVGAICNRESSLSLPFPKGGLEGFDKESPSIPLWKRGRRD